VLDLFDARPVAGAATPTRLQLDLDGPGGRWHVLALFNWLDQPADLVLHSNEFYLDPQLEYLARSFWDGRLHRIGSVPLRLEGVPAHGAVLLAARPARPHLPQYLGGDLHFSQGLELAAWRWDSPDRSARGDGRPGQLSYRLARPGLAQGVVDLALPQAPREICLNGEQASWQAAEEGIYRLQVAFDREAEVVVRF
jgi:hypothetical protein